MTHTPPPLDADPFTLFKDWMEEAKASEPVEPEAMAVVTVSPQGKPSARMLLLKGVDSRGFVFFTNKESRKSGDLEANSAIALLFHWKSLLRQVRIEGVVEHVSEAESDAYFASRARESKLGAWASPQSRPMPNRGELERRFAEYEAKYPGNDIPRPGYWAGYRVLPDHFEFWLNMPHRLHDRTIYDRRPDGGWTGGKLYP